MVLSRLDFLKGALSAFGLGALGGRRIFAAPPGWNPPANPNLTFGVVSDTHLRTSHTGKGPGVNWPDKYFVAALTCFREQNVDAVMHCGDLAHRGLVRELEFHARAWNKVFPKNLAPDGHEVVKLFVNGNHDVDGSKYGDFVANIYPDPAERAKRVLATDMAGHWQRIWGEPYEEVWHKEVKGYHFFGRHYGVTETKVMRLVKEYAKKAGIAKGPKPFFLLSHVRSHAKLNRALKPYRNAVNFFGHWHRSAANWNNIYFWGTQPTIQVPSCEPRGSGALGSDAYIAKAPIEGVEAVGKCRQGYLVKVYDDMVVIARREFGEGGSLGPDWIMPLGAYDPNPLSKDELKKKIGEPQFKEGAKLAVGAASAAPAPDKPPEAVAKVEIPLADGNPESRVYAYDVAVAGAEGEPKLFKSVYAAGCNMGIGHEPGTTTLNIPLTQLPKGESLTFAARPLSSLGTVGRSISTTWKRVALAVALTFGAGLQAASAKQTAELDPAWAKILVQVKSSLDGTFQPCYFWAPSAAKTNAVPLIVGLHTWSADYRQTSHYATVLKYAREKGWAMVGPNFRGPNKTPPACGGDPAVQDIVDAVNYAKAHVKIDPARVYIVGGSGGGHMTLLMLGRHPEIFTAGAAFCPITDIARWHADSLLVHPGRGKHYAKMLEGACGGTPAEKPEEYAHRSPLTWLDRAKKAGVGAYIVTGIHDGWKGSVPVGHSFRAFNALANPQDRVSEADIAAIEETQQVPAALAYDGPKDPFYSERIRIHFRRTSANVRFTLMEGGHGGNFAAGLDFLSRQVKGRPTDFSLPATGKAREEALGK